MHYFIRVLSAAARACAEALAADPADRWAMEKWTPVGERKAEWDRPGGAKTGNPDGMVAAPMRLSRLGST